MTKRIGDYFAQLGGGNKPILDRVPQDRARFIQIGGVLVTTASTAAISMNFALHDGVKVPLLPSIFLSLLWGVIILNLDRFLVLSMDATRDRVRQALIALAGILLQVVLAFVISTPVILRIFASDINAQLLSMHHAGFSKADTSIFAQLQALSELSAKNSIIDAARYMLLALFILIGILPVIVKFLLNLGPPSAYDIITRLEEDKVTDSARLHEIQNRRTEERESQTIQRIEEHKSQIRVNIEDDMRKREEELGMRANEHVAAEMAKILDDALKEWSDQVHARLSSDDRSIAASQPTEGSSPTTKVQVNPGFGLPADDGQL